MSNIRATRRTTSAITTATHPQLILAANPTNMTPLSSEELCKELLPLGSSESIELRDVQNVQLSRCRALTPNHGTKLVETVRVALEEKIRALDAQAEKHATELKEVKERNAKAKEELKCRIKQIAFKEAATEAADRFVIGLKIFDSSSRR
jgi:gas vesicle protein